MYLLHIGRYIDKVSLISCYIVDLREVYMPTQSVGFCPHCGNTTPQSLEGTCARPPYKPEGAHYFFLAQCQTCHKGLTYRSMDETSFDCATADELFDASNCELVWPSVNILHPCVPASISKIYTEASAIKTRAPNAFAGQIRRSLEAVCADRGTTRRTLAQNLDELVQRGEIPQTLSDMTDILRQMGNVGSHAGDEEIAPEYVDVLDDFFRVVIEYVYVAPHKVTEFRARLNYARQTGQQPI